MFESDVPENRPLVRQHMYILSHASQALSQQKICSYRDGLMPCNFFSLIDTVKERLPTGYPRNRQTAREECAEGGGHMMRIWIRLGSHPVSVSGRILAEFTGVFNSDRFKFSNKRVQVI